MYIRKNIVLPDKLHRIHHELFREVGLRSAECSGTKMFKDMPPSVIEFYSVPSLRTAVGKNIYSLSR